MDNRLLTPILTRLATHLEGVLPQLTHLVTLLTPPLTQQGPAHGATLLRLLAVKIALQAHLLTPVHPLRLDLGQSHRQVARLGVGQPPASQAHAAWRLLRLRRPCTGAPGTSSTAPGALTGATPAAGWGGSRGSRVRRRQLQSCRATPLADRQLLVSRLQAGGVGDLYRPALGVHRPLGHCSSICNNRLHSCT